MTKRELVERICEETDLSPEKVFDIVQKTLDYISEALGEGRKVELRKFGVFDLKVRKGRMGRNPKRPSVDVPIPAVAIVKFRPGNEMRAAVTKVPISSLGKSSGGKRESGNTDHESSRGKRE